MPEYNKNDYNDDDVVEQKNEKKIREIYSNEKDEEKDEREKKANESLKII